MQPAAVLLDLSMPEMDGDEVLAAACKADPAICGTSPSSSSPRRSRARRPAWGWGPSAFLAKPFRADELLTTVERALAKARGAARRASLALLRLRVGRWSSPSRWTGCAR